MELHEMLLGNGFYKASKEKMNEWYDAFNSWRWPWDFPMEKPRDFYSLTRFDKDKSVKTIYSLTMPIMREIESVIGEKEILRWHHLHNLNRNIFQFEYWWLYHHVLKIPLLSDKKIG